MPSCYQLVFTVLSNMVSDQENRKLRGAKHRPVVLDLDELTDMAGMTMQSEQRTFVLPDSKLKRIDYVLVYPKKSIDEMHGEEERRKFRKQQDLRQKFQAALLAEGVLIQRQIIGEKVLLKLHVPFQRLCEEAERTRLEMPLSKVSNWLPWTPCSRSHQRFYVVYNP